MNLREHDHADGMAVWLSTVDSDRLIDAADTKEQEIAFSLGVRCGLRSHEILQVRPSDIVDTDAGTMLVIEHGKGDKYRETPIPSDLATMIQTAAEYGDSDADAPIISVTSTRSLRRWVKRAADQLADETDDTRWRHLSTHDLRRTWATALADADVDPLLALDWGGWNDLETFLDHYKGAYSPEAQRRNRDKVAWL